MEKPLLTKEKTKFPQGAEIVDAFSGALREYFYVTNPSIKKGTREGEKAAQLFAQTSSLEPLYAFFPWRNQVFCIPPEEIYFALRTARNRNLITATEQDSYRSFRVGIAGLSVGSSIVAALVRTGGPKQIKISDADTIEISNLNRIEAGLPDVGKNKAAVCAQKAWEIDPFAQIDIWKHELTASNLEKFFLEETPLDLFVDEMDTLEMKIQSRHVCKEHGVPVVMGTDNGDGVIIDVERFDLDKNAPLFHGRVSRDELEQVDQEKFTQFAIKVIDPAYMTERQQDSIAALGSEVSGIAQLGSGARIAGAGVAFVIRQIACGNNIPSGRYVLSCEESCMPQYTESAEVERRWKKTLAFAKKFDIKPVAPKKN